MDWPLLASLGDADRKRFISLARRRRFARGEVVFHEGDPGNTLHLVEKGHFAVRITTPLGDVGTLRIHGPGGFFGELAVISPAPRSATVSAVDKAETLSLTDVAIAELRAQSPAVDRVLLEAMVGEVRRLSGALVEALYVPVNTRVVRRLIDLTGTFSSPGAAAGDPVSIPITQEELAQLAGTTRPTANRVLGELEERGIVAVARGRIDVIDLDALAHRGR